MKIAIVALTDFDITTSTVRRVHMIGKGLAVLNHEVHVVIPQRFRDGPLTQEIDGLTIHWGTITSSREWYTIGARLQSRWATIRLIDTLAATGLDWLILYNLGLEGIGLLMAAKRHGTRVAAEYCDLRVRSDRPKFEDHIRTVWHSVADALVPRNTDLNIGISRFLEQWLRAKAPRTPTLIIPPLVDTDLFQVRIHQAKYFRGKWQIGSDPVIAYLGSYWTVEGLAPLLKAASTIAATGERFRLVISGAAVPGRDCDDVPGMVKTLNLDRVVIQTGWLPTDEVIAAMSAADILVVPKTDHIANRAGVATKMAEYLSMGRALVATNIGDVPLYLRDGNNALLCQPNNESDLANKLRLLLNTPTERLRLGINARQTALQYFDYRSAGSRLAVALQQAQQKQ